MKFDFQAAAEKLCVDRGLPKSAENVETVKRAMEIGAATVAQELTQRLRENTDEMIARRLKANAPQ
jgi:D-ribose pyranose/furanose isomerase RbsD